MADVTNEVLQPTGLTPAPVETLEPEPAPAAPPADDAGEAQPVEQPADDQQENQATAQAPAAPSDDDPEAEAAPKKPSRGVQKALDRLTERALTAERLAQQQATALAALMQGAAQAQQQPKPQQQSADIAPTREQYPDWEQFNRATAQWEARQASNQVVEQRLNAFVRQLVAAGQAQQVQTQEAVLTQRFNTALKEAETKIPDWDEVKASDLPTTPLLEAAIKRSEDPAHVMHYLSKNPEAHMQMLNMPPDQLMYQMGRIAALKASTVASKAPPPAKPVGGRGSPNSLEYRDDFTPAQHKAWLARTQGR